MRQGRVFCNGIAAGIITEDEQGYTFVYDVNDNAKVYQQIIQ